MSAHVLLNLLKELDKTDKMRINFLKKVSPFSRVFIELSSGDYKPEKHQTLDFLLMTVLFDFLKQSQFLLYPIFSKIISCTY